MCSKSEYVKLRYQKGLLYRPNPLSTLWVGKASSTGEGPGKGRRNVDHHQWHRMAQCPEWTMMLWIQWSRAKRAELHQNVKVGQLGPRSSHFYGHDTLMDERELLHTVCVWHTFIYKEFQLTSLARRPSLCSGGALVTLQWLARTLSYILNIFLQHSLCPVELGTAGAISPIPQMSKYLGVPRDRIFPGAQETRFFF